MTELIKLLSDNIVSIAAFLTALGVVWKTCGKPIKDLVDKVDRIDGDTADLLWDRLEQGHDFLMNRGYASTSEK